MKFGNTAETQTLLRHMLLRFKMQIDLKNHSKGNIWINTEITVIANNSNYIINQTRQFILRTVYEEPPLSCFELSRILVLIGGRLVTQQFRIQVVSACVKTIFSPHIWVGGRVKKFTLNCYLYTKCSYFETWSVTNPSRN